MAWITDIGGQGKGGALGFGGSFGSSTFSNLGGAVSDLFAGQALRTKAKGSRIEAEEYDLAGGLARQNKQFAETSTAIKTMQTDREVLKSLGQTRADVAASGFAASGSALDILRDSAAQGALTKATLGQQGLIEEASYEQQAKSYDLMAGASRMAADADDSAAWGADIAGALKAVASIATVV